MEILRSKPMVAALKTQLAQESAEFCRARGRAPKLVVIRDNDEPVIAKYVELKRRFGSEIGVEVEDELVEGEENVRERIAAANRDAAVDGMILQLPIRDKTQTEALCDLIAPEKDVDGLGARAKLMPATVKAILELLAYYHIELSGKRIAVVGRGKLVGAPLMRVLRARGLAAEMFHRGSDLGRLREYEIIVTATGVPGVIGSADVAPGTVVVDAGTASEKGVIKGDLAPELYEREDLAAITPKVGGVGPATVACLFENLLAAVVG